MSDLASGLHDVFVIETSGICIFEQEFMPLPKPVNKDMMGGFLSAIDTFSTEMTGQRIQIIQLETISVHYTLSGKLYFVVVTATDIDRSRVQSFLSHVKERFVAIYGDYVENGNISNVSKFEGFAAEVEKEVGKTSKHRTIFSEPVEKVKERFDIARDQVRHMHRSLLNGVAGVVDKNLHRIMRLLK
ncbi:MAG: hypothetical protein GYA24_19975 [Candidatus Lokiarchaeota archaeon]|nr:hypothetical protein [Candidatus Lokiarchaeota archaeon]